MTERRSGLPLKGLAQGMATTLVTMFKRVHTAQYPDVGPELPPRSRGAIALFEENCTVCMLCARECPDWCIYIDSHKETTPATTPGGRDRSRNVLDRFAIDFSLCMYCGICVEVCPFDALFWSPEFEYSEPDIADLTHEKDRLREWMWTVPPPPAPDDRAEPDKVEVTAQKAADAAAAAVVGGDHAAAPASQLHDHRKGVGAVAAGEGVAAAGEGADGGRAPSSSPSGDHAEPPAGGRSAPSAPPSGDHAEPPPGEGSVPSAPPSGDHAEPPPGEGSVRSAPPSGDHAEPPAGGNAPSAPPAGDHAEPPPGEGDGGA